MTPTLREPVQWVQVGSVAIALGEGATADQLKIAAETAGACFLGEPIDPEPPRAERTFFTLKNAQTRMNPGCPACGGPMRLGISGLCDACRGEHAR